MKRPLVALSLLLFTACSGPSDKETDSSKQETNRTKETSGPDQWIPPKPATSDNIQVTITQAGNEPAHVLGITNRAEIFAARLKISNTSHSKRSEHGRAGAPRSPTTHNQYRQLAPTGTGVVSMPVDPTEPVSDVLFFETPITTAGYWTHAYRLGMLAPHPVLRFESHYRPAVQGWRPYSAALAVEAENKAKAASIAAKEAEAKRAEAQRQEENRLAVENAKARQREAELAAEKSKQEAEAKRRADELAAEKSKQEAEAKRRADALAAEEARQKAELEALPGELAAAQSALEVAKDKLRMIKLAESGGTYPYSGAMPEDFDAGKKKYIYFGMSQRLARTKEVQEAIEKLTAEIASFEARIAAKK